MDTQSFACKEWKISGTGKDQQHNLIWEMNCNRDVDTRDCGCLYVFTENNKGSCNSHITLSLLTGVLTRIFTNASYIPHTHTPFLCFSWEEHTLSSGVWQLRHYCVPHVICAVYPLHNTGDQVAAGQLSTLYTIIPSVPAKSILLNSISGSFHGFLLLDEWHILLLISMPCWTLSRLGVFLEILQVLARKKRSENVWEWPEGVSEWLVCAGHCQWPIGHNRISTEDRNSSKGKSSHVTGYCHQLVILQ